MARSSNLAATRCSRCGRKFRDATKTSQHIRRAHPRPGSAPFIESGQREAESERDRNRITTSTTAPTNYRSNR